MLPGLHGQCPPDQEIASVTAPSDGLQTNRCMLAGRVCLPAREGPNAGSLLSLCRARTPSRGTPSEKCSSDRCGATSRWAKIAARTLRALSVVGSRSRFLVKTVGAQTGSSTPSPTNQRKSRLQCICLINCRSDRIDNRIWIRLARNNRSGAIYGRPSAE